MGQLAFKNEVDDLDNVKPATLQNDAIGCAGVAECGKNWQFIGHQI